mmetsp:Transcript_20132/g.3289  ORF Transcript_20132/g.3289 Transcript_20132/m.3289 type:complete len:119 (+) Transcript_20132:1026-1382(+)
MRWYKLNATGRQPTARSSHTAVLCKNQLFIMGGRNDSLFADSEESSIKEIAVLNIKACQWEMLKLYGDIPDGRWGAFAEVIGSKIFYLGGMKLNEYKNMQMYQFETDSRNIRELVRMD